MVGDRYVFSAEKPPTNHEGSLKKRVMRCSASSANLQKLEQGIVKLATVASLEADKQGLRRVVSASNLGYNTGVVNQTVYHPIPSGGDPHSKKQKGASGETSSSPKSRDGDETINKVLSVVDPEEHARRTASFGNADSSAMRKVVSFNNLHAYQQRREQTPLTRMDSTQKTVLEESSLASNVVLDQAEIPNESFDLKPELQECVTDHNQYYINYNEEMPKMKNIYSDNIDNLCREETNKLKAIYDEYCYKMKEMLQNHMSSLKRFENKPIVDYILSYSNKKALNAIKAQEDKPGKDSVKSVGTNQSSPSYSSLSSIFNKILLSRSSSDVAEEQNKTREKLGVGKVASSSNLLNERITEARLKGVKSFDDFQVYRQSKNREKMQEIGRFATFSDLNITDEEELGTESGLDAFNKAEAQAKKKTNADAYAKKEPETKYETENRREIDRVESPSKLNEKQISDNNKIYEEITHLHKARQIEFENKIHTEDVISLNKVQKFERCDLYTRMKKDLDKIRGEYAKQYQDLEKQRQNLKKIISCSRP